jgi:trans-2,3-dihydro-3-hydroxyanthranilate isomerase
VTVQTERHPHWFAATMDQGVATFGAVATPEFATNLPPALNLAADDMLDDLPPQMVTTGLPYLIVPVRSGLERARITHPHFAAMLAEVGAQFVYVVDVARREGRTWDNAGLVEDIATGSAAGPAGAYLVRHGRARADEAITLQQGRFLGRPSELRVRVANEAGDALRVAVSGDVVPVGVGTLHVPTTP